MKSRSDQEVIAEFNRFMEENPKATRNQISKSLKVGIPRLEGLVKLPPKTSPSEAGRLGKKHHWGKSVLFGQKVKKGA